MGFAGGFTLGMRQAGFEIAGKRELPGGFGIPSCEANRHLLGYNWKAEMGEPNTWSPISADVVHGNPPCSGFSVMTTKNFRGANSPINKYMWAFVEYVAKVRPQIAVFESVALAFTRADGQDLMRQLHAHLEALTNEQWNLYHVRHNALSLGGSAMRRRYFWVVSRIPFGVEIPRLRRLPSLKDVIGDLQSLSLTMNTQPYREHASWWAQSRLSHSHSTDGHVHVNTPLSQRIKDLLAGVPWVEGEDIAIVARRYYEKYQCLPDSWSATAEKVIRNNFNMGFTTPVRWDRNKAARVITGGSLYSVVHPWIDRLITHREAARIMGFPDNWNVTPIKDLSGLPSTWGKGITVDCGRWIGAWIKEALDGNPGGYCGKSIGEREHDIDVTHAYQHLVE